MDDPDDEIDSFWMFKVPLLFLIIVIIIGIIRFPDDGNEFEVECSNLGGITAKAKVPEGYKALICIKRSDVIIERPL